jgi:hypothetical protein
MTHEFWGEDLTGALFRDVNLTDATITHAWLVNVQIDALVDRLVINGVDVTAFVNERDPWYPLRAMLRPTSPADMRTAWSALDAEWNTAIDMVRARPEAAAHAQLNGEFSFVQTLRHLVFADDKWFTVPVLGEPFHPSGLPNTGSLDFPFPGLDYTASPTFADALAVFDDRRTKVRAFLDTITEADFDRPVDVLENGEHPLQECIYTLLEEGFWHLRYALRDLQSAEA